MLQASYQSYCAPVPCCVSAGTARSARMPGRIPLREFGLEVGAALPSKERLGYLHSLLDEIQPLG